MNQVFTFKEKQSFVLSTGFEDFKLKIYTAKSEEEKLLEEYVVKMADHLVDLIDQRDHIKLANHLINLQNS